MTKDKFTPKGIRDLPNPLAHPNREVLTTKDNIATLRRLKDAMSTRIENIHELWKNEHGYSGIGWNEILEKPEIQTDKYINLTPGFIDFEDTWQKGDLFQTYEFKLNHVTIPIALEATHWSETITEHFESLSVEQRYAEDLKRLSVTTKRGEKIENWNIFFVPDSPPFAINEADARYLGFDIHDPTAANPIRKIYGEESVPLLSNSEMELLTMVILNTPAKVSGAV